MGGSGSGRKATGFRATGVRGRLTTEEKVERNRVRARERWQRLKEEKEKSTDLSGYEKYKLSYKVKYHNDEERLGYLRESSLKFALNEDPYEFLIYVREKNRKRLDEILNDPEAIERIFSDRDDISELQRNAQRQKKYYSEKEIKEMERKLNEEFNIVEDRRPGQSTYKKTNEDGE
jgi:hypothetical protein